MGGVGLKRNVVVMRPVRGKAVRCGENLGKFMEELEYWGR